MKNFVNTGNQKMKTEDRGAVAPSDLLAFSSILGGLLASGHFTEQLEPDYDGRIENTGLIHDDYGKDWKDYQADDPTITGRFVPVAVQTAEILLRNAKRNLEANNPTGQEREAGCPALACSPLTGNAAVREWQPSWKHHHMPMWFKKAVRQRAIKLGEWKPGISWAGDHLPSIFDHWGSFSPDSGAIAAMPSQKVAAMPYGANDDEARAFASEIGCNVECLPQGPWHPATRLYIFSENEERTST